MSTVGAGNSNGRAAGVEVSALYGMDALVPKEERRLRVVLAAMSLLLWPGGVVVSV